jgi:CIC family chloride channel protein
VQRPRRALNVLGNRLETGRVVLYGLGVGGLVGVFGTVFAYALEIAQSALLSALSGFHPPGLSSEGGVLQAFVGERAWVLPVLMALGLVFPVLLERAWQDRRGTPLQIKGDGLDIALEVYHNNRARLGAWAVLLRSLAGLVSLGVGTPLGREGPFVALSSGIGSLFASWGRMPDEDRRLVFLAGLAAGLGLVLRAPLAGAVLAIELLYRRFEFEIEGLTPAVIASVVAYAIYGVFRGFAPLFALPDPGGQPPSLLPAFFVLGLLEALCAAGFVAAFRGLGAAWNLLKIPDWARLALVGVVIGGIGIVNPGVLGDGLGWVQLSLSGFLPMASLAVLFVWRALVTLLAGSAGGTGGLLVPSLVLGGLIGNLYALGLSALFPGLSLEPAAFTLTGMAAFLAGTMNVPLGATILITEWNGYSLLVPLLLTTAAGYALTGRESLLKHQAESRSSSPVHIAEYLSSAMRMALPTNATPVPNSAARSDLLDLLSGSSLSVSEDDAERLYRMSVPEVWISQAVRDLEWPPNALLVAILREGHVRVPRGNTVLEARDELIVMAEPDVFARLSGSRPNAGAPSA